MLNAELNKLRKHELIEILLDYENYACDLFLRKEHWILQIEKLTHSLNTVTEEKGLPQSKFK